jgi:hypothetical protein
VSTTDRAWLSWIRWGESYDQIYSLLRFASVQTGGFLKPPLAQRLMNLCQTIAADEPSKFGWTLFARAAANSIGFPAIAKVVRWNDQDVAELSYGLPQLACFLAESGKLDPRRAAFILTICEDHGWWDWRSGDGVAELLKLSAPADQRRIFQAVLAKLRAEHPLDAWPSLWDALLETGNKYPTALTTEEREAIEQLRVGSKRKQDEFNARNNSSLNFTAVQASKRSEVDTDSIIATLVSECDVTSASSIDNALKVIEATEQLPFRPRQRFIVELRAICPYPKRLAFLFAVCGAGELNLSQSLDILRECFTAWSGSSTHLASNAKALVERLFECKGAELFEGQSSNIERGARQLSEFCGDTRFVLQLVLRKIAADEVELDGDEWLQLATTLCDLASGQSGLDALELLLAGPASRIADEVGEGPFRADMAVAENEAEFIADVIWHILGDEDAYVRWTVARGLNTLVELGLNDDLSLLLDRFDQRQVAALASKDRNLSFQNSQQWLLMGLARAALRHGRTMGSLRPRLLALAQRTDLHVIHKVHISRCLRNISHLGARDAELEALLDQTERPQCGIVTSDTSPPHAEPSSGFRFDYEFKKNEISNLARLFNTAPATVEDVMAAEITMRWPEATSLEFFSGHERYQWDRGDRHELYREHIQRHALLNAATSLAKILPVVVRRYETNGASAWLEWRNRYDVTFDDGSWLSDRKDPTPQPAKEPLLGKRIGQQETLQDQESVLRKLGFVDTATDAPIPLYGSWSSPDGVTVRISSALTERKGAVSRCVALAKQSSHDLWLPEFWDEGYYDQRFRRKSPFAPLVWPVEAHNLGIDVSDEIAAEGAGARPRLGVDITNSLAIVNDPNSGNWRAADGRLALRSEVWGSWKPNPDQREHRHHDNGEILWASPGWLTSTLSKLKRYLIFTVTLYKYSSSRDYDPSTGVNLVLVALRAGDGTMRWWQAKRASKLDY